MKIETDYVKLLLVFITIMAFSYGCIKKECAILVVLKESQSICATESENPLKYGKIYAARFVLESRNKELFEHDFYFSNEAFYVNSLDTP